MDSKRHPNTARSVSCNPTLTRRQNINRRHQKDKAMKKIALALTLATALATPAMAVTPEYVRGHQAEIANVVAGLYEYHLSCGGLPPKTLRLTNETSIMLGGVNNPFLPVAIALVMIKKDEMGAEKFCAGLKPVIKQIEEE